MPAEDQKTKAKIHGVQALSAASCSAPWAWTHEHTMEYWNPVPGRLRADAIAEGKRRGYKKFWIAKTRRMTDEEKEEYDGSWIVDQSTKEQILLNKEFRGARRETPDVAR